MNTATMALCFFLTQLGPTEGFYCLVKPENVRCYYHASLGDPIVMTKRNCEYLLRRRGGACAKPEGEECRPPEEMTLQPPYIPRPPVINRPKM